MTWTVTKENRAVSFSSWLAQEAAAVEAERHALLQAFRMHPPFSLKPASHDEPDPFLSEVAPWQAAAPAAGEARPQINQETEALHQRIGGIAHEFNNLFTVVIGNLELVEAALQGDARAEDSAAEAVAAAHRGAQLTRRLMALAGGLAVPVEVLDDAAPGDDGAPAAARAGAADEPMTGMARVLVVEDHHAVRATAAGYLRGLGYEVVEAESAVAALRLLQDHGGIDVLFTDVDLPGAMNGFDLSQAACLIRPGLKVIHASGHPKGATVYEDEPRLSDNLIAKPYRREHLRRAFEEALAQKRQGGEKT